MGDLLFSMLMVMVGGHHSTSITHYCSSRPSLHSFLTVIVFVSGYLVSSLSRFDSCLFWLAPFFLLPFGSSLQFQAISPTL